MSDLKKIKRIVFTLFILIFILGWLSSQLYSMVYADIKPYDFKLINNEKALFDKSLIVSAKEKASPYDWIKENQIHVYNDKIIIDLKGAEWSYFADTNSMDPVLDLGSNGIEIKPRSENDIHVGDIVSYTPKGSKETIIHRVIETGKDSKGKYFILKGDNNPKPDPDKVKFNQIKRILVAVIY